jgi:glc operon protein GlcG
MHYRACLSVSDVQRAIAMVLEEASKEPQRPIAVAIVDDRADLLGYARMDNVPAMAARGAQNKAYTSAMMRTDTVKYKEQLKERGSSVADTGDPRITAGQGGLAIVYQGAVVGGIGVSGHASQRDEELARIGLQAMHLD